MNRLFASASMCVALAACSDGDPAALVTQVERGFHAPVGVMVGADNYANWAKTALAGWSEPTAEDKPGTIKYIKSVSGCDFTKPSDDEMVVRVAVDRAVAKVPIFASSMSQIKDDAQRYIEAVKKNGVDTPVPDTSAADQLGLVDVAVTDKSKPIYLVLTHSDGVIFNIHTRDGVKISRIALLGDGPDGVVNTGDIPVESLNGSRMRDCKVMPARAPANYWRLVKDSESKPDAKEQVALIKQQADAFSAWYKKSFGADSEEGVIGAAETSHVIVGPLPQETNLRVTYNPFAGAIVYMTPRDVLVAGSPETYIEKKKALILQAAKDAAGGDLSKLAQQ